MTKQIEECVDMLVYTMKEFPHDNKIEAVLEVMLTTMSIFLSNKDIIDMIKNKVIPKLSKRTREDYFKFISEYLNELEIN